MNVGVFAESDDAAALDNLTSELESSGFQVTRLLVTVDWEYATLEEFRYLLAPISHFITIVEPPIWRRPWATLLLGYAGGKDIPFARFGHPRESLQPPLLNAVPNFDRIPELLTWLNEERLVYEQRVSIEAARAEIFAAGVAITDDSFLVAAKNGDLSLIHNFMHLGFPPDTVDERGVSALHAAIRNNHARAVALLLNSGGDVNLASGDRGDNALGEAVATRDPDIVDMVLRREPNVDHQNKSGQTALVLAIANGDERIAKELLSHGADPTIPDAMGMNALRYAKLFRRAEIVAVLES